MGRNGTSGAWTRVHSWATDKTNAVKITASRFDAEHDDFASGLAASIVEDGQNPFTANQPMGGKNFTGVGDATARSSFAAVSQIADGNLQYLATIAGKYGSELNIRCNWYCLHGIYRWTGQLADTFLEQYRVRNHVGKRSCGPFRTGGQCGHDFRDALVRRPCNGDI